MGDTKRMIGKMLGVVTGKIIDFERLQVFSHIFSKET